MVNPRGSQRASWAELTHRPGRSVHRAGQPQLGPPSSLGKEPVEGEHLPTVVHGHEITDQQEGVGQHAHCNLKSSEIHVGDPPTDSCHPAQKQVHAVPRPYRGLPPVTTRAGLLNPTRAHRAIRRAAGMTYPHHKFGVAPDGQGLAELKGQKGRPVCHRYLRTQPSDMRALAPCRLLCSPLHLALYAGLTRPLHKLHCL